jgi:hypothetical protein
VRGSIIGCRCSPRYLVTGACIQSGGGPPFMRTPTNAGYQLRELVEAAGKEGIDVIITCSNGYGVFFGLLFLSCASPRDALPSAPTLSILFLIDRLNLGLDQFVFFYEDVDNLTLCKVTPGVGHAYSSRMLGPHQEIPRRRRELHASYGTGICSGTRGGNLFNNGRGPPDSRLREISSIEDCYGSILGSNSTKKRRG